MHDAVHLEGLRCDGLAYGGCQAGCLIFWKNAWLKRVSPNASESTGETSISRPNGNNECTDADVLAGTKADEGMSDDPTYVCQITQLPAATKPLSPWNIRQYVEDYTSGNVGFSTLLGGFVYATYNNIMNLGIGVGAFMRWIYDGVQRIRGGVQYPRKWGAIPRGEPTPTHKLDLKPGDLVRIKSFEEILKTVDTANRNRGLYFDAEMVPYCGGTYRVRTRVERMLNEKTGKMMKIKNDCIILENVFCRACYSEKRYFCPRAIYSYWREIWLERVPEENKAT